MHQAAGRCVITAGSVVLSEYDAGDIVMRNMVLGALRQLGFPGRAVARVLGRRRATSRRCSAQRSGTGRRRWSASSGGAGRAR